MSATSARDAEHLLRGAHPTVRHAVESMLREERTRWAMQIHDGLTQSVTSAILELQTLQHRIETDPAEAVRSLKEVEEELREDIRRIRELLFAMTSTAPDTAGPALSALVRDARERWHLATSIEVEGDLESASEEVLDAAYAIVSEALANAGKHAGVAEAHVRVTAGTHSVRVEIEDRGRGIAAVTDDDPHFGLQIMQARADQLGGSLEIGSTPGRGTVVVAVLPVGGRGEEE